LSFFLSFRCRIYWITIKQTD
ncbi:hypothetical protein AM593_07171, partial [Mytilus galloprovincialis]